MRNSPSASSDSKTPILDRLEQLKDTAPTARVERYASAFALAASFVLECIVVWGVVGLLMSSRHLAQTWRALMGRNIESIFRDDWAGVRIIVVAGMIVGCGVVAVAVHELGHLLAGWAVNLRLECIRVFRLQFVPPLKLSWTYNTGQPMGIVFMAPSVDNHMRARYIFFFAGGPIASALLVVCLWFGSPQQTIFQAAVMCWSAFLLLITVLPQPFEHNDIDKIVMLLRDGLPARRLMALMQTFGLHGDCETFGEIPLELARDLTLVADPPVLSLVCHSLAYHIAWDRDPGLAAEGLEVCLRGVELLPSQKNEWFADAAIFQATKKKRADLAQAWVGDLSPDVDPTVRLLAESAALTATGDTQGALEKIADAEKHIVENETNRKESRLAHLNRWRREVEQLRLKCPFAPEA